MLPGEQQFIARESLVLETHFSQARRRQLYLRQVSSCHKSDHWHVELDGHLPGCLEGAQQPIQ
jgi:hypothetical protein